MWEQPLVDSLGNEGCERGEPFRQREENFKESVEGVYGIINTEFSL
jgi:hypothetical protein